MTEREEDRLCAKLDTMIEQKLATRPIRFCAEHEAMKKRTWLQSAKMLTAIATVLGTCAASVWWVSMKSSEAAGAAVTAISTMQTGFVDQRTFANGQAAQDDKLGTFMNDTRARIDRVQITADETNNLVQRIAGKLDVKQDGP